MSGLNQQELSIIIRDTAPSRERGERERGGEMNLSGVRTQLMVCRKKVSGRRVDSRWLYALQLKLRSNTTHSHGEPYKEL